MRSGECIKACDYGVNPRFMLAMARVAMAKSQHELPERRRQGLTRFRDLSRDVTILSRMQLDGEALERLGQRTASAAIPAEAPDFVFYTGCNVLKRPHIALLALDIMDALGVTYQVVGEPTHCCGIHQLSTGDIEMSGRMGSNSIAKMSHSKSGQVISWCRSCYVQFTETTIPAIERQGGSRPFEMNPYLRFLRERLALLIPRLRREVKMRVALHRHPGVPGVMEAAAEISIPGVELVDLQQPAVGLQRVSMSGFFPRSSASCSGRTTVGGGCRCGRAGRGISFRPSRTVRA
jgi:Fe-S oxidoreductase